MSAPPLVIQGQLVDAKNVSTHKCVRLSIDVPAEFGAQVVKTFGWPTMAEPVLVAVARLNGTAEAKAEPVEPKERQKFSRLRPSAQAALRCREPTFWKFLTENYADDDCSVRDERMAALVIRGICKVSSRSEFDHDDEAAQRWFYLRDAFDAWVTAGV